MNFRTTVILVILLMGALTFYIVASHSSDSDTGTTDTKATDSDKGRRLLDINANDVQKLVVRPGEGAPAGAKLLEMTRAGTKWTIAQPVNWPADSFDGRNFVELIANLRSTGSIELNAENLASTGLAKPRYRIELTDAGGKVQRLAVGERSPLGHLYVQANDEKTGSLVSGGPLGEKMGMSSDKLVAGLRDKQILSVSSFDVKQIRVNRGARQPVIALQKDGADWKMTAPVDESAESSEVSDILSTATNLRAEEFSDDASAASAGASFNQPRAILVLSTVAPTTQPSSAATQPSTVPTELAGGVTVIIGQATDVEGESSWVKVLNPPVVAKVRLSNSVLEKITKASALSLRDRKAADLKPDDVSEIMLTVDRPATTQPTSKPAEQKTLRIARRKENLNLGPAFTPTAVPVAASPTSGPATMPDGAAATTAPTTAPTTVASASTQPTTQVAAAAPTTTPAATQPVAEAPKSKWVIESEGSTAADDTQVSELLDAMHPLKATKYVETAPTTQPSPNFALTVKTVGAGGASTATYEVRLTDMGATNPPVARFRDLVFELDRSFLRKLEGDFKTKRAEPPMPSMPPSFPGGGLPGGFPGGG